ncbi:MAG: hypothetical protein ACYTAS_19630, partial [Planctomycetota bacterium]
MRAQKRLEDIVKQMSFTAEPEMERRLWEEMLATRGRSETHRRERGDGRMWRILMDNRVKKLAIAAVVCGGAMAAAVGVRVHRYFFLVRSYTVERTVSDFPASADLSTPEAAYATIMRDYMATGASSAEWAEISTWQSNDTRRKAVSPEKAEGYLEASVCEVIVYKDRLAAVLAKWRTEGEVGYDGRMLFLHNGRWLNVGHDGPAPTLKKARTRFLGKADRIYGRVMESVGETPTLRWNRPAIAAPESHLKPYVAFLRKQGREPHAFMMEALRKYRLVAIGEIHHRPAYWAFNSALVRDSAFAESVGTIYLELPSHHQGAIDRFLTQTPCEKELVIAMLRDFFELGWPCQPTLDFFVAVWEANQAL